MLFFATSSGFINDDESVPSLDARHWAALLARQLRVTMRLMALQQFAAYSITSSARPTSGVS